MYSKQAQHQEVRKYNPQFKKINHNKESQFMTQLGALIQKLHSPIAQIRSRTLTNLYMKITHNLISPETLLQHEQLPGLFMGWINDNKKKSDLLLKVIIMLGQYAKSQHGLVLLRRYECLEFCDEFRRYLAHGERGVDVYLRELDHIIHQLTPLGRANTQHPSLPQQPAISGMSDCEPKTPEVRNLELETLSIHIVSKPPCLSQQQQKQIFELAMQLKYAHRDGLYHNLCLIRDFVHLHSSAFFRCKADLCDLLTQTILASGSTGFAEICLDILDRLMQGHVGVGIGNNALFRVNLMYAKIYPIPIRDQVIRLPYKLFKIPSSFLIVENLIKYYSEGIVKYISTSLTKFQEPDSTHCSSAIYLAHLLSIRYPYSPHHFLHLLSLAKPEDLCQNVSVLGGAVDWYSAMFPHSIQSIIKLVPEQLIHSIARLSAHREARSIQSQFQAISPYLHSNFCIQKNLHLLPQMLTTLKQAIPYLHSHCNPALSNLLIHLLLQVTVSQIRNDMFNQYYQPFLLLLQDILDTACEEAVLDMYMRVEALLTEDKNSKNCIEYAGTFIRLADIGESIFGNKQFVDLWVSVGVEVQTLIPIVLRVFTIFVNRDKFKGFLQYVPFINALCYHPNPEISSLSQHLYEHLPKQSTGMRLCLGLFCSEWQNRSSILASLHPQLRCSPDIILRLSQSQAPSKKQLKLSQQSIDNYLNIILNPDVQLEIKDRAVTEFLDYLDRVEANSLTPINEAHALILDQVKKIGKKTTIGNFDEKLLHLHLLFTRKVEGYGLSIGIQTMLGMLTKVEREQTRCEIIKQLYFKVFQSPFITDSSTKHLIMMLYPHLEISKMKIQAPRRHPPAASSSPSVTQTEPPQSAQLDQIDSILVGRPANLTPSQIQCIQEKVVSSITTSNTAALCRLSFLLSHSCTPAGFRLSRATMKIIQQYIRTNPTAADFSTDLGKVLAMGEPIDGNWTNGFAIFMRGRVIEVEEVEVWMKGVTQPIQKMRLFAALVRENSIKFAGMTEYSNLKLIQMIITQLRSPTNLTLSLLSLGLLKKLCLTPQIMVAHVSTLISVLHQIMFEQKPTFTEFGLILSVLGELLHLCEPQIKYHNKLIADVIERVCTILTSDACLKQEQKGRSGPHLTALIGVCFAFINQVLRMGAFDDKGTQYHTIVVNSPINLVLHGCSLLSKSPSPQQYRSLSEVYTFLYFSCYYNSENISILLNSTDVVQVMLSSIVCIVQCQDAPIDDRLDLFEGIGRLLHLLALRGDQFVFRVNKCIRTGGTGWTAGRDHMDVEFKLHYGLMAAIPVIVKAYKSKSKKQQDLSYIKMVMWVLYTWNQETEILEQQHYLQPLISHILQTRCLQIVAPLLAKSCTAQRMILSSIHMIQKFKMWVKIAQQLVFQVSRKDKRLGRDKDKPVDVQELKDRVKDGLLFGECIFAKVGDRVPDIENGAACKDSVSLCLKFIDQVHLLLQTHTDQILNKQWQKLVVALFHNQTYSKPVSSLVSQGAILSIQSVFEKLQRDPENMVRKPEELKLLGMLAYNESIRSLLIKNRIVDQVLACVYACSGQEIKNVKDYAGFYSGVEFLGFLSVFKDTNAKIQNDKKIIDLLSRVLTTQPSEIITQKILDLLINLSAFKHSKSVFMASRQIHKTCLGLLSDPDYTLKEKLLSLVYNILYKNAAGIKMYKKKEVCELVGQLATCEELEERARAVLEVLESQ